MAAVSIHEITKNYGATPVLRGINLDIQDGEFLVLVGPSGCGKSTLLRMVAGLESITTGTIRIDGKEVNNLPPKDRDIAMVFQNYALYPHMNVEENLSFSLRLRNLTTAQIEQRTSAAAEILGLQALLKRYPRQLSGGQRQRVAMGRAIVRDPKAFLFDEPLSNLDAKLRVSMRAEIKTLQQRLRTTSIYVTHDQAEAMTMADRIVVMNDGIIEQQGIPLALYDHPVNRFVAGFIGSPAMNFLDATVDASTTHADLSGAGRLLLDRPYESGRPLELGIRPEHLSLDQQGSIAGQAVVVEPTGLDTLLYVACPGQTRQLCALLRERVKIQPGDPVRLAVTHPVLVFDPGTGRNLAA